MKNEILLFAALAAPSLASLADLASCDPLKKDSACPPDPAFGEPTSYDFKTTSALDSDDFTSFWSTTEGDISLDEGVTLTLSEDQPRVFLTSEKYIFFGKVTVEAKAAQGAGVVTAISLKSDSGDEIDWELLGAFEDQAATNYFYNGEALFNTYNTTHAITPSSFAATHTYTVEYTAEALTFSIDGAPVKAWTPGDIPARKWPQTPMQVRLGIWAVKEDADEGLVLWVGGRPDWEGEYTAWFGRVEVEDYKGGCEESGETLEYAYDEGTVGWESVEVRGCSKRPGADGEPLPVPTTPPGESDGADDMGGPGEVDGPDDEDVPEDDGGQDDPPGEEGEEGEEDDAAWVSPASTLAAVVCIGWLIAL